MGIVGKNAFYPLGYSSTCEINDSAETGSRITKESGDGFWEEKFVKKLSEQITASGFVYDNLAASKIGLPQLKEMFVSKTIVTLRYRYRNSDSLYEGRFIITSLKQSGPADGDETWDVTFDNSGPVTKCKTNSFTSEIIPDVKFDESEVADADPDDEYDYLDDDSSNNVKPDNINP